MNSTMGKSNNPRLIGVQCTSLIPVETVHENPWFSVCKRNGFFTIEYKMPQVLILPVVDNKAIVMVRVYRPLIADCTLELPSGGALNNETPIETAARELAEETGIVINNLDRFEIIPPLIDMVRNPVLPYFYKIHLTEHEFELRKIHDQEIESVECFLFYNILNKIANGEIYISLSIAVIVRYFITTIPMLLK